MGCQDHDLGDESHEASEDFHGVLQMMNEGAWQYSTERKDAQEHGAAAPHWSDAGGWTLLRHMKRIIRFADDGWTSSDRDVARSDTHSEFDSCARSEVGSVASPGTVAATGIGHLIVERSPRLYLATECH